MNRMLRRMAALAVLVWVVGAGCQPVPKAEGFQKDLEVNNIMRNFSNRTFGQSPSTKLGVKGLTKREREVFMWVIKGKTNWEIGNILGISSHTVSKHLESVFLKLGVHSRIQAFNKALGWFQNEQHQEYDHVSSESPPRAEVA